MNEDLRHSDVLEIDIFVEPDVCEQFESFATDWEQRYTSILHRVWDAEAPHRASGVIGVVIVGRDRIHELNREFRGKDQPTDVLSFDLSDTDDTIEGEIYIGLDRAIAQADEIGCSLGEELARLMIHGTLHLAGHDHADDEGEQRMLAATELWVSQWLQEADSSESR